MPPKSCVGAKTPNFALKQYQVAIARPLLRVTGLLLSGLRTIPNRSRDQLYRAAVLADRLAAVEVGGQSERRADRIDLLSWVYVGEFGDAVVAIALRCFATKESVDFFRIGHERRLAHDLRTI